MLHQSRYSKASTSANSTDINMTVSPGSQSYHNTRYHARLPDTNGFINYPTDEQAIWHDLMTRQQQLFAGRACQAYLSGLQQLGVSPTSIPQLSSLDNVLQQATRWRTAQVPALISFKRFFELLANREFPVATFIRCREDFDYIKEPDIFHEVVGHCPLLANPAFAAFNQTYGKLGLIASKAQRSYLARLYWFTVEFGLLIENSQTRIYGGGILSSPTETIYALTDEPEHREFNLLDMLRTPYRIDRLQPIYYVIDGIDTLWHLAETDLLTQVDQAMAKGLFDPHPSLLVN